MAVKSQQYFCVIFGERLTESLGTNVLVLSCLGLLNLSFGLRLDDQSLHYFTDNTAS